MYLVVMGTSARPLSSTAGARCMNATTGRSRNSSSPTRTLEASAPAGIFFMKWRSIYSRRTALLAQALSYSSMWVTLLLAYVLSYSSMWVTLLLILLG